MRCRNYVEGVDNNGVKYRDVVWFNHIALVNPLTVSEEVLASEFTIVGTKFKIEGLKNYSEDQEAVANSLTQKLSTIKGELWAAVNFGLPLFDKYRSRAAMDASVIDIITSHSDVVKIIDFTSNLQEHAYTFTSKILTKYGELALNN